MNRAAFLRDEVRSPARPAGSCSHGSASRPLGEASNNANAPQGRGYNVYALLLLDGPWRGGCGANAG